MSSVSLDVVWPDTLPLPYCDAQGAPQHAILASGIDSAKIERRLRFSGQLCSIQVQWIFTIAQYIEFKAFFLDDLDNGAAMFPLELRYPKNSELTEWVVRIIGEYVANYEDGNWAVSATIDLLRPTLLPDAASGISEDESWMHDSSSGLPDPFVPEVAYTDCKDEITIQIPNLPGLVNAVIEWSTSEEGTYFFWGETRSSVTEIKVGNYFADKWIRITGQFEGEFAGNIVLFRFQADPPDVLPPTHVALTHHLLTADYVPTTISSYRLIYQGTSAVDPTKRSAAVYPGNLIDPSTGLVAYTVPLFTSAFIEVSPRYSAQFSPGGGADNTEVRITLASETPGAALRLTTDGTDPTLSNGFDTEHDINPLQDIPRPRSVVICRAFKDGCKSPPLYILVDMDREATPFVNSRIHVGSFVATQWCGRFLYAEQPPPGSGMCLLVPSGGQPGASSDPVSPCAVPGGFLTEAVINACDSATVNDGGLVLQDFNVSEALHFDTSTHYDGPDPHTCPSGPWGGGQWRYGVDTVYLESFTYMWESVYTDLSGSDLYLVYCRATVNGFDVQSPDPGSGDARPQAEELVGATGSTTNDVAGGLLLAVPAHVRACPGDGATATLTEVQITQTCCAN